MQVPETEIARWWTGKPFPLEALIMLYQLAAAYELLGWQLSSGARPISRSSENRLGAQHQWIHDKNSARGIESRVIPLLNETRTGLRSLQHWTSLLIHRISDDGITVVDRRKALRDTPSWFYFPKRGRRLMLRDMQWSDLSSLNLPRLPVWPRNVARHSLATFLREHIPDAEVDALLGHARHGRMLSSPRADASIGKQSHLRKTLKTWLSNCGYRSLSWDEMPWFF